MPHVILLGTLDTKLNEFLYLRSRLLSAPAGSGTPVSVTLIDCGRSSIVHEDITVTQPKLVARYGPRADAQQLLDMPRGDIIRFMSACATQCVRELISKGDVHAVMSAGGSGGSSLAATVMREAVPIGLPKLIVSTVASGDTGPLVGETDITLMYSVVDIAGSNELLRNVLGNAAAAVAGMASSFESLQRARKDSGSRHKTRVGVSMFGVTTPCVDAIREHLEDKHPVEVYVFHATGHGGRAMERLVEEGRLDAVLDVTTTEICDLLMGGNMSAGPGRLEAALKAGIPNVISLGATDMVNFGPRSSVPARYDSRRLLEHNPTVTLMRTTAEESSAIGRYIVETVKRCIKHPGRVGFRIPKGGVSMISTPGAVFEDVAADGALAETIRRGLEGLNVNVVDDERDINDKGFAIDIAEQLMQIIKT